MSRVLNDEPHVKDEVRERVLAAARELGYRPNGAARALLSGRTHRIGVVALGSPLYGPASLLLGLEREARARGYALSVVNTDEDDAAGVALAVESLLRQGVDAIALSEPIDLGRVDLVVEVPVLTLGPLPGLRAPVVIEPVAGSEQAAYEATRYLLDLGHDTVHHVAGPRRWLDAQARLAGWRRALADAGAPVPDVQSGDWTAAGGYAAGVALADRTEVSAVFAANDDMAIGVMRALTASGRRVPEDVSVVGVDDVPLAAYVNPPLTTMAQPFEAVASAGLASLIAAVEHPQQSRDDQVRLPARLVVRDSTAPAARPRARRPAAPRPDEPHP